MKEMHAWYDDRTRHQAVCPLGRGTRTSSSCWEHSSGTKVLESRSVFLPWLDCLLERSALLAPQVHPETYGASPKSPPRHVATS